MVNDPITLGGEHRWLELAALGCDAWNTWADNNLRQPPEQRAAIDLSECKISHADWAGYKFPGHVNFSKSTFVNPYFSGTRFFGSVSFSDATFEDACFQYTTFDEDADFSQCVFKAEKTGHTNFNEARFGGRAFFNGTHFTDFVQLHEIEFAGDVEFSAVNFDRNVTFSETTFAGYTRFINTTFHKAVDFEQTKFDGVVRFDGAEFTQPPDLRTVTFKFPPSVFDATFLFDPSQTPEAYRFLKKLADDDRDHHNALKLFAFEMRARRAHVLKWTRLQDWSELGLSYFSDITSDYGRSVVRPILFLAITFLLFAYLFALLAGQSGLPWTWTIPVWVAAFINLLPFLGQPDIGREVIKKGLCGHGNTFDQQCLAKLYAIGSIECLLAVVFLFLLVLGFRNIFFASND